MYFIALLYFLQKYPPIFTHLFKKINDLYTLYTTHTVWYYLVILIRFSKYLYIFLYKMQFEYPWFRYFSVSMSSKPVYSYKWYINVKFELLTITHLNFPYPVCFVLFFQFFFFFYYFFIYAYSVNKLYKSCCVYYNNIFLN